MARLAAAAEQLRIAEAALAAGRFPEAAEALRKTVRLDRDSPRPQLMLAFALWQSGEREQAIGALRRLIQRAPGNGDAWFNLGNFYRTERRTGEALAAFKRAADLQPGNVAPHINAAHALVQAARFEEAEDAVRSSLRRFPSEPDLLVNLAQVQRATHRLSEALATLERCVELAPGHAGYRVTRALARLELGEAQAAHADLDEIVREHPESPEAHLARAQLLLARREYAAGWRDYLWRRERATWLAAEGRPFTTPAATLEELVGRPVVLCGEQGLGDILFFLRFASVVERVAASVHVEVEPRLRAILPVRWASPAPANAVRVLVGDLVLIAGGGPVPPLGLSPEGAHLATARARLAQCGQPPYLGITWQGGIRWQDMPEPGSKLFKRVPPEVLGSALAASRATLVSVQRAALPPDLAALSRAAGRPVHDFSDVNDSLPDALAVLSLLDDYVAVSNTNVHFNDSLGKRTRALVTQPAEWRWCLEGERSPWFTNAILYRQGKDGAWDDALARLKADLELES
ncbi:MAG TPA: tetratricopeptide repeat protein [Burkholderiales bacterium]